MIVRMLGRAEYGSTWDAMRTFTQQRTEASEDELGLVEHPPVFTLGMNAAREHVLAPGDIPLVQIDRGGQVTYHGPGQLVVYPLLDVRRCGLGVRQLVMALENGIIALLASWNITAVGRRDAPGRARLPHVPQPAYIAFSRAKSLAYVACSPRLLEVDCRTVEHLDSPTRSAASFDFANSRTSSMSRPALTCASSRASLCRAGRGAS